MVLQKKKMAYNKPCEPTYQWQDYEPDHIGIYYVNAAVVLVDDENPNNIFVISNISSFVINEDIIMIIWDSKYDGFTTTNDGI